MTRLLDPRLHALLALTLLTLTSSACGGCGDDASGPASGSGDNATSNNGTGDMQGGGGNNASSGDMGPALPSPAYIVIDVDPVRPTYAFDDTVTLTATLFDTDDQPFEVQDITWEHAPSGAAIADATNATSWTFSREGEVIFKACSMAASEICAERAFIVDLAPPQITITEPLPGQEISGEQTSEIIVRGTVTDGSNAAQAFLNGQPLSLDASGAFEARLAPSFGVNHIKAVATDDRQLRTSSAELDVLFAETFHPTLTDGTSGVQFEDGLLLHLGQRFFDDRARPITSMDGAVTTRDIADILLLLIERIDLTSLVPNPISDSASFQLSLDDVRLIDPEVAVHVTEQGIELFLSVPTLEIDTQGLLNIEGANLNLEGTVFATVSILASIAIDKPSADEPFLVEVSNLDVAIEQASSDFVSDEADAVFTLAESALRLQLESVITDTLDESFIQAVPELLQDTLNGLETSLADQTFTLDPMLGSGPIDIRFAGKMPSTTKDPRRAISLPIDATLAAQSMPTKTSLGVAMSTPFTPFDVELVEQGRVQIALRLALINGLLHGLWNANFLEIQATEILPPDLTALVKEARISAKLPPLLRPPLKGEGYDLMLEIGQMQLELRTALGDQLVTYGVLLRAGVDLSLEQNQLSLTISEDPEVIIWIIGTEDGRPATLDAEQLTVLFEDVLWPQITESLGEGLALPLPALDISNLGGFAPSLSDLTLQFQEVRELEVRDGFLILQANLEGELPAPMP